MSSTYLSSIWLDYHLLSAAMFLTHTHTHTLPVGIVLGVLLETRGPGIIKQRDQHSSI